MEYETLMALSAIPFAIILVVALMPRADNRRRDVHAE
jgi:hypothetical protein